MIATAEGDAVQLQWGHAFDRVEIGSYDDLDHLVMIASMGPRF